MGKKIVLKSEIEFLVKENRGFFGGPYRPALHDSNTANNESHQIEVVLTELLVILNLP